MANPLKGEVELVAGELGVFTLVLDNNALASLQAALGLATGPRGDLAFLERLPHLAAAQPHDVRLMLFWALHRSRRGPNADPRVATLEDAGYVMDAAGIAAVREALVKCLLLTFPEVETGASPPPKADSLGAGAQ